MCHLYLGGHTGLDDVDQWDCNGVTLGHSTYSLGTLFTSRILFLRLFFIYCRHLWLLFGVVREVLIREGELLRRQGGDGVVVLHFGAGECGCCGEEAIHKQRITSALEVIEDFLECVIEEGRWQRLVGKPIEKSLPYGFGSRQSNLIMAN